MSYYTSLGLARDDVNTDFGKLHAQLGLLEHEVKRLDEKRSKVNQEIVYLSTKQFSRETPRRKTTQPSVILNESDQLPWGDGDIKKTLKADMHQYCLRFLKDVSKRMRISYAKRHFGLRDVDSNAYAGDEGDDDDDDDPEKPSVFPPLSSVTDEQLVGIMSRKFWRNLCYDAHYTAYYNAMWAQAGIVTPDDDTENETSSAASSTTAPPTDTTPGRVENGTDAQVNTAPAAPAPAGQQTQPTIAQAAEYLRSVIQYMLDLLPERALDDEFQGYWEPVAKQNGPTAADVDKIVLIKSPRQLAINATAIAELQLRNYRLPADKREVEVKKLTANHAKLAHAALSAAALSSQSMAVDPLDGTNLTLTWLGTGTATKTTNNNNNNNNNNKSSSSSTTTTTATTSGTKDGKRAPTDKNAQPAVAADKPLAEQAIDKFELAYAVECKGGEQSVRNKAKWDAVARAMSPMTLVHMTGRQVEQFYQTYCTSTKFRNAYASWVEEHAAKDTGLIGNLHTLQRLAEELAAQRSRLHKKKLASKVKELDKLKRVYGFDHLPGREPELFMLERISANNQLWTLQQVVLKLEHQRQQIKQEQSDTEEAIQKLIKKAYQAQVSRHHPDKLDRNATEAMKTAHALLYAQADTAYHVLKTPAGKSLYDQTPHDVFVKRHEANFVTLSNNAEQESSERARGVREKKAKKPEPKAAKAEQPELFLDLQTPQRCKQPTVVPRATADSYTFSVSWDATQRDDEYILEMAEGFPSVFSIAWKGAATKATIHSSTRGGYYRFRVTAFNAFLQGQPSIEVALELPYIPTAAELREQRRQQHDEQRASKRQALQANVRRALASTPSKQLCDQLQSWLRQLRMDGDKSSTDLLANGSFKLREWQQTLWAQEMRSQVNQLLTEVKSPSPQKANRACTKLLEKIGSFGESTRADERNFVYQRVLTVVSDCRKNIEQLAEHTMDVLLKLTTAFLQRRDMVGSRAYQHFEKESHAFSAAATGERSVRAERARHAALEARLRRDTPARLLVATRRLLAGRSGAYELAVRILAAHPDDGQVDVLLSSPSQLKSALLSAADALADDTPDADEALSTMLIELSTNDVAAACVVGDVAPRRRPEDDNGAPAQFEPPPGAVVVGPTQRPCSGGCGFFGSVMLGERLFCSVCSRKQAPLPGAAGAADDDKARKQTGGAAAEVVKSNATADTNAAEELSDEWVVKSKANKASSSSGGGGGGGNSSSSASSIVASPVVVPDAPIRALNRAEKQAMINRLMQQSVNGQTGRPCKGFSRYTGRGCARGTTCAYAHFVAFEVIIRFVDAFQSQAEEALHLAADNLQPWQCCGRTWPPWRVVCDQCNNRDVLPLPSKQELVKYRALRDGTIVADADHDHNAPHNDEAEGDDVDVGDSDSDRSDGWIAHEQFTVRLVLVARRATRFANHAQGLLAAGDAERYLVWITARLISEGRHTPSEMSEHCEALCGRPMRRLLPRHATLRSWIVTWPSLFEQRSGEYHLVGAGKTAALFDAPPTGDWQHAALSVRGVPEASASRDVGVLFAELKAVFGNDGRPLAARRQRNAVLVLFHNAQAVRDVLERHRTAPFAMAGKPLELRGVVDGEEAATSSAGSTTTAALDKAPFATPTPMPTSTPAPATAAAVNVANKPAVSSTTAQELNELERRLAASLAKYNALREAAGDEAPTGPLLPMAATAQFPAQQPQPIGVPIQQAIAPQPVAAPPIAAQAISSQPQPIAAQALAPIATPQPQPQLAATQLSQPSPLRDETQEQLESIAEVAMLLAEHGLGRFQQLFAEQEIALDSFVALSADNLSELGVTALGPRIKMTRLIEATRADLDGDGAQHAARVARIRAALVQSTSEPETGGSGGGLAVNSEPFVPTTTTSSSVASEPDAATYQAPFVPPQFYQPYQYAWPDQHQQQLHMQQMQQFQLHQQQQQQQQQQLPQQQQDQHQQLFMPFGDSQFRAPADWTMPPNSALQQNAAWAPSFGLVMPPAQADTADNTCVICFNNPKGLLFDPCGHVCVCVDCAPASRNYNTCPICTADIENVRRVFVA